MKTKPAGKKKDTRSHKKKIPPAPAPAGAAVKTPTGAKTPTKLKAPITTGAKSAPTKGKTQSTAMGLKPRAKKGASV